MAGGGSMLSIPILIFMGLPSAVANGTNRVALLVQNLIAVTNYRQKGYFELKLALILGVPAFFGSVIGSRLAIDVSDTAFKNILAIVMIAVVVLIIWQPYKKFTPSGENLSKVRLLAAIVSFFFVGMYGGFIQIGVGFLIMTSLHLLTGMDLVKINSLKVLVVLIYMTPSLIIFLINGKVNLLMGLTLAVGNGIGAWLGSNLTISGGEKWVKIILFVSVAFMAGRLFGLY
jgi:hypothetical protein